MNRLVTTAFAVQLALVGAVTAGAQQSTSRAPASPRSAAPGPPVSEVVLEFDQTSRALRIPTARDSALIEQLGPNRFRLRQPGAVQIRVVHTNTALYEFTTDTAVSALAAAAPLGAFAPRLAPYLPQLFAALIAARAGGHGGVRAAAVAPSMLPDSAPSRYVGTQRALETGHAVERDVRVIDGVVYGDPGIERMRSAMLNALDLIGRNPADTTIAGALRDSLNQQFARGRPAASLQNCARVSEGAHGPFGLGDSLRRTATHLRPSAILLAVQLADPAVDTLSADGDVRARLRALNASADSLLRASDTTVADAYHVENLTAIVATACSRWESDPVHVTAAAGRVVTLKIQPRPDPEIARVAPSASVSTAVTVLPPLSVVEPSIGLSIIAAPGAKFYTYATRVPAAGGGGKVEIYQQSVNDARYSWGVTLGLTWRAQLLPLDWRDRFGVAVWLPDLTVGQDGGANEFGIGSAVSFGVFKIGAGTIWIRHSALNGQNVGDLLPNSGFLQTKMTYGAGKTYISISLFGVPPFLESTASAGK